MHKKDEFSDKICYFHTVIQLFLEILLLKMHVQSKTNKQALLRVTKGLFLFLFPFFFFLFFSFSFSFSFPSSFSLSRSLSLSLSLSLSFSFSPNPLPKTSFFTHISYLYIFTERVMLGGTILKKIIPLPMK